MSNLIKDAVLDNIGVPKFRAYLNLSALRHKLIAGNVSNVLTPGYKAREIDFENEYLKAMDLKNKKNHITPMLTHSMHIPIGGKSSGQVKIIESKSRHSNGINNVNIDKEMTSLSTNQLSYTIAARMIKDKFTSLRKAITGSR